MLEQVKKIHRVSEEMHPKTEVLAHKPKDLSSILVTHIMKTGNELPQAAL